MVTSVNGAPDFLGHPLTPVEVEAMPFYGSRFYQHLYKSQAAGMVSFLALAEIRLQVGRPGLIMPYARKYMGRVIISIFFRNLLYGFAGLWLGRTFAPIFSLVKVTE